MVAEGQRLVSTRLPIHSPSARRPPASAHTSPPIGPTLIPRGRNVWAPPPKALPRLRVCLKAPPVAGPAGHGHGEAQEPNGSSGRSVGARVRDFEMEPGAGF